MRLAKPVLLAAAVLAGVLALPPVGQAQSAFDAQQRQAIEQVVKDYLLEHPEVLQAAMTELERRQQEAEKPPRPSLLRTSARSFFQPAIVWLAIRQVTSRWSSSSTITAATASAHSAISKP